MSSTASILVRLIREGWLTLLLAATAFAVSVAAMFNLSGHVDWQTYANAVGRVLRGDGLYAPAQLSGPYRLPDVVYTGYAYPPASVILLAPFTLLPMGHLAWLGLNLTLLLTGIAAALRRELGHALPLPMATVLLVLAIWPIAGQGLAHGNANVGLAGLLAWGWAAERWRAGLGPASAIAGHLKLVPAALALWGAREGGRRTLLTAGITAAGGFALSVLLLGYGVWGDYLRALQNAQPACSPGFSIACFLGPWLGSGAAKAAGIATGLALGLGVVVVRSRLLAFVMLTGAIIAPVTDLHAHYWLFHIVLVIVLVACGLRRRREWRPRRDAAEAIRRHRHG